MAPVDDVRGNETGIGNNDRNVVIGSDRGTACCNVHHVAVDRSHFNAIANLYGSFKKNNNPADKIVGDVL